MTMPRHAALVAGWERKDEMNTKDPRRNNLINFSSLSG